MSFAPEVRRRAPLLGEHTREILSETGYADGEIEKLVKKV
jgi:formyl-CoA transferase